MHWYSAAIAFRTGIEEEMAISISLLALRASDADTAHTRAEVLGRGLAKDYEWVFEDVIDVYEISDEALDEGVELYSFFVEESLLASIRAQVAQSARSLEGSDSQDS